MVVFFKNPTISNAQFESLKSEFPNIVGYPNGQDKTKVAAGWLIEQAGWKGYTHQDAGVHKKPSPSTCQLRTSQRTRLVLVNYGQAKGRYSFETSLTTYRLLFNKNLASL